MNTESFSGQMDFVGLGTMTVYDLGDFAYRLSTYGYLLCDQDQAAQLEEKVNHAVLHLRHGDNRAGGQHTDAHGLSIFIPYRGMEYQAAYGQTRLAQDTMWDEFLQDYYGVMGIPPEEPINPGRPPVLELPHAIYLPLVLRQ